MRARNLIPVGDLTETLSTAEFTKAAGFLRNGPDCLDCK